MLDKKNIFSKKKILVYGLGISGLSAYKFLRKDNKGHLYDNKRNNNHNIEIKIHT